MSSERMGEFGWIGRIRASLGKVHHGGIGIGDDAAVLPDGWLWTTDALVEGVHFLSSWPMDGVGYKSLACNVSDIAAMGGRPLYALLTVGLPFSFSASLYEDFLEGFGKALQDFGVDLMGGDTVRSDTMFFSVTLMGRADHAPVLRSGAREGDIIYVSGRLGESAIGLELLLGKKLPVSCAEEYIRRHLYPPCRIPMMQELVTYYSLSSAIDCSDGFIADLNHIADESGMGYEVFLDRLPAPNVQKGENLLDFPWPFVMGGGEDYEIILTCSTSLPETVRGVSLTPVGRILLGKRRFWWKQKEVDIQDVCQGYTHF